MKVVLCKQTNSGSNKGQKNMLTRRHLVRHGRFLQSVTLTDTAEQVRKLLRTAAYFQLRTLIVLLASVVLKKVPVPGEVAATFGASRKKKTLKKYFLSWAKVRQLLRHRALWRDVLGEVAPLLKPAVKIFFATEDRH